MTAATRRHGAQIRDKCSGGGSHRGCDGAPAGRPYYDASAHALPPLNVHQHTVETEHNQAHGLFAGWKRRRSWNGATLPRFAG